jgi:hypothetical protein
VILGIAGVVALIFLGQSGPDNSRTSAPRSTSDSTAPAAADAQKVCNAMINTGLVIQCTPQANQLRIEVAIHTSAAEAQEMCQGIRDQIAPYTNRLRAWSLRISSPIDGTMLTSCSLR